MSDFKKLRVWRKAHALMLNVHRVAASIRGSQYAALRSQMVRAMASADFVSTLDQLVDVRKMLHGLIRKISPTQPSPPKRPVPPPSAISV